MLPGCPDPVLLQLLSDLRKRQREVADTQELAEQREARLRQEIAELHEASQAPAPLLFHHVSLLPCARCACMLLTAISPHMPCLQAVSTRTGLLHDLESKLAAETVCTAKYRRMVRQDAAQQSRAPSRRPTRQACHGSDMPLLMPAQLLPCRSLIAYAQITGCIAGAGGGDWQAH